MLVPRSVPLSLLSRRRWLAAAVQSTCFGVQRGYGSSTQTTATTSPPEKQTFVQQLPAGVYHSGNGPTFHVGCRAVDDDGRPITLLRHNNASTDSTSSVRTLPPLTHDYVANHPNMIRSYTVVDSTAMEEHLQQVMTPHLCPSDRGPVATSSIAAARLQIPAACGYETFMDRELHGHLAKVHEELQPLLVEKAAVDAVVDRWIYPGLKYMSAAGLVGMFVVYVRWVFVIFDWNLIEPVTYFLGYTATTVAGMAYHYFYSAGSDYTAKDVLTLVAKKQATWLYRRKKVDVARIELLQKRAGDIERALRRCP